MISARPLRLALNFVGGLLLVLGLLWALQGLGLVQWPADSAMLADRDWAAYGLVATAIGAAILRWAGRMDRA